MAAADGGATPLQNAMKMAKVAIQLDGGNQHKEAYCEYLRTISYISNALLEKAGTQKEKEVVEEERMLMLAEQCLERAKSFIGKQPAAPNTVLPRHPPVETSHKATSPTRSGHRSEPSDAGGQPSPFVPPEVFHELQTVESQDTGRRELTPIEQASRLNQKLKANYEARLARLTPAQVYQKTSLTNVAAGCLSEVSVHFRAFTGLRHSIRPGNTNIR